MENDVYVTLQEYLTDIEGLTYIALGVYLILFIGIWSFISGRNEDEY